MHKNVLERCSQAPCPDWSQRMHKHPHAVWTEWHEPAITTLPTLHAPCSATACGQPCVPQLLNLGRAIVGAGVTDTQLARQFVHAASAHLKAGSPLGPTAAPQPGKQLGSGPHAHECRPQGGCSLSEWVPEAAWLGAALNPPLPATPLGPAGSHLSWAQGSSQPGRGHSKVLKRLRKQQQLLLDAGVHELLGSSEPG